MSSRAPLVFRPRYTDSSAKRIPDDPVALQRMIKLNPRIGIGTIRFGMKRDQAIAMLGSKQTWEPWMGGKLKDSLFYPGIILLRGWRMANPVDDGGGLGAQIRMEAVSKAVTLGLI
jgi:hypothetical protein